LHPDDIKDAGLAAGDRVDLTSRFGEESREVRAFRGRTYDVLPSLRGDVFPRGEPAGGDRQRSPTAATRRPTSRWDHDPEKSGGGVDATASP